MKRPPRSKLASSRGRGKRRRPPAEHADVIDVDFATGEVKGVERGAPIPPHPNTSTGQRAGASFPEAPLPSGASLAGAGILDPFRDLPKLIERVGKIGGDIGGDIIDAIGDVVGKVEGFGKAVVVGYVLFELTKRDFQRSRDD